MQDTALQLSAAAQPAAKKEPAAKKTSAAKGKTTDAPKKPRAKSAYMVCLTTLPRPGMLKQSTQPDICMPFSSS